ncbi:HNH endonuclease signature motif containing protein [Pseudonocardia sp. GCM10023141]|uniref:HNH endonuclease signature motif containing protein n=1 Tax=Pseudonocardia sp. GCM10023141 TaxID=3252653 RepID=UPI0036202AF1
MMVDQQLPSLAALPPGPELLAALTNLDFTAIPQDQKVDVLQATWRQTSQLFALYAAALDQISRSDPDPNDPHQLLHRSTGDWADAEIAAALTFTGRRTGYEREFASILINRLPLVYAALLAGRLDHHKARVFADYLADLTDPQIEAICARLVPPAEGWTTGQLAQRLLREVLAVDRSYSRKKYQAAVRERGVTGYLAPDGTATITAHGLTPTEAAAAAGRLEDLADAIRRAGHPGTVHQVRADLFVRLLGGTLARLGRADIIALMVADGRNAAADTAADTAATPDETPQAAGPEPTSPKPAPAAPAPSEPAPSAHEARSDQQPATTRPVSSGPREGVEVRVGAATLLGLDDQPAELPRWGPILAEQARELVRRQRSAQWLFAITDSDGYLLHGGLTTRRPYPAYPGSACRGGIVEIHLPLTLLHELAARSDLPDNWAMVIADIAQQYAHRLDPSAGTHPRARFARAALERHVRMRDRTCVGPGCTRQAIKTELDHTLDHAYGGLTVDENLDCLCAFHHALKHRGGWRLTQPSPGQFVWRSPLGRIYRTRGAHIAPDLPAPVPREEEPEITDRSGAMLHVPILEPPRQHEPEPPAPAVVDLDDLPPF